MTDELRVAVVGAGFAGLAAADALVASGIEVVVLEDTVSASIREALNRVRFDKDRPIVVEVPGPAGPNPDRPDLLKLIREAVGIKL